PRETGASSLEKVLISCCSLPSKRLKLSRSSPVTRRFIGSVIVTGTNTIFTSTLSGLVWVLRAGSISGSFGGSGCMRGWMWTSSVEFWPNAGRMLTVVTARKTANAKRANKLFSCNIGPTHDREVRAGCWERDDPHPERRVIIASSDRDTSTFL